MGDYRLRRFAVFLVALRAVFRFAGALRAVLRRAVVFRFAGALRAVLRRAVVFRFAGALRVERFFAGMIGEKLFL